MRTTQRFLASAVAVLPLTFGAAGMAAADTNDGSVSNGDVGQHQQVDQHDRNGSNAPDEGNEGLLGGVVHGLLGGDHSGGNHSGGNQGDHGDRYGQDHHGNRYDQGDRYDEGSQPDSGQATHHIEGDLQR